MTNYVRYDRLPERALLIQIAQLTQCSLDWLCFGTGSLNVERGTFVSVNTRALAPAPRGDSILEFIRLPLIADPIAAGAALEIGQNVETYLAFSAKFVQQFRDPICLRVGRKEESMMPTIHPGDVVVINRDSQRRLRPRQGCIYACNVEGGGTLKRIELVSTAMLLIADNPNKHSYPTMLIHDPNLLEILVGEVVWIGRYME